MSDHLPVTCILSLPVPYYKQSYPVRLSGCDWSKANVNSVVQYQTVLDKYLSDIIIDLDIIIDRDLLHCDKKCCQEHNLQINSLFGDIVDACIGAGSECIPQIGRNNNYKKTVPHWKEYVEPHRNRAIFWHNIWKDCGSPRNGVIAESRCNTRAKYHQIIRGSDGMKSK